VEFNKLNVAVIVCLLFFKICQLLLKTDQYLMLESNGEAYNFKIWHGTTQVQQPLKVWHLTESGI